MLTQAFANLGATAARAHGFESLRWLVLPHPVETLSDQAIKALANDRFEEILDQLCASA